MNFRKCHTRCTGAALIYHMLGDETDVDFIECLLVFKKTIIYLIIVSYR